MLKFVKPSFEGNGETEKMGLTLSHSEAERIF